MSLPALGQRCTEAQTVRVSFTRGPDIFSPAIFPRRKRRGKICRDPTIAQTRTGVKTWKHSSPAVLACSAATSSTHWSQPVIRSRPWPVRARKQSNCSLIRKLRSWMECVSVSKIGETSIMAAMNMQGKVCLVTGSSSGIGKVTARELARMGATVVMVCRNRAKGEAAQAEIKEASGNAQVDLIVADLSELSQVRRAASSFTQKYTQLHVLINNAGG